MTKVTSSLDVLERRLGLLVAAAAVAVCAVDPTQLPPKWAAAIVAAQGVAHVLTKVLPAVVAQPSTVAVVASAGVDEQLSPDSAWDQHVAENPGIDLGPQPEPVA